MLIRSELGIFLVGDNLVIRITMWSYSFGCKMEFLGDIMVWHINLHICGCKTQLGMHTVVGVWAIMPRLILRV